MLHRLRSAGRAVDPPEPASGKTGSSKASKGGKIEGGVEGATSDAIAGWAWDADLPYDPVEVELYCGDFLLGRGLADKFDLGLAKANRGNGVHRFEIQLERLPPKQPPFTIRAIVANSDVELGPALTIQNLADAERLLCGSEYIGEVSGIVNGAVRGWVLNRRNSHESPVLTLRDGDREIGTQVANGQINKVLDSGTAVLAFQFELPLPLSILDGRLHNISVFVGASGGRALGAPILFGASDLASIGRTLVAISDRLDRLERRLDASQPSWDVTQIEKRVAAKIVEPVDMLLTVHRDSMEREMALVRRQITEIREHVPQIDSDQVVPVSPKPAIEDISIPLAANFDSVNRSGPLIKYDFSVQTPLVRVQGDLRWAKTPDGANIALNGNGALELEGAPNTQAALVIRGSGASEPAELSALVLSFNGKPLSGRFDLYSDGEWAFTGNTIELAHVAAAEKPVLSVSYLRDVASASGRLRMGSLAVFSSGRAPARIGVKLPLATVVNLGRDDSGFGWHSAEAGPRGGICWMGESSDLFFNLQPAGAYDISIPEIRPLVPGLMSKLQITIDGETAIHKFTPMARDSAAYTVQGRCIVPNGNQQTRTLRIRFPKDEVKSPMELGLNPDLRPLSIAVRCIVVAADLT